MNYAYKMTISHATYQKYKTRINRIIHNFGKITTGKHRTTIHYSAPKTYEYNRTRHISQAMGGSDWRTVREARVEQAITQNKYDSEFWQK